MNHTMPMMGAVSLLAAFLAGLTGSVHCLAMCGGLSGALTLRIRRGGASGARTLTHSLTYQLGRLTSYALIGALLGGIVGLAPSLTGFAPLGFALRTLAGLVLVAAALGVLFQWRALARLEKVGARLWQHLAPIARKIPSHRIGGSFLLGMLWGWLPCGMVYSMALLAALSGGAARGAGTMLSFGLGTLPAVLTAGLASAQLLRIGATRLNATFGILLLGCGILTLAAPWTLLLPHLPM